MIRPDQFPHSEQPSSVDLFLAVPYHFDLGAVVADEIIFFSVEFLRVHADVAAAATTTVRLQLHSAIPTHARKMAASSRIFSRIAGMNVPPPARVSAGPTAYLPPGEKNFAFPFVPSVNDETSTSWFVPPLTPRRSCENGCRWSRV